MRVSAFPVYYGWLVLAASALCEMLVMGATSYAAGLFVLPLQAEFQVSRAAASSAILVLFLGAAIAAPFVGRLLDRHPIRLVMCCGAIILGLSLSAIALSPSLLVMALILMFPAAFAFMAVGPLTTSTLASRWFYRRRGLALGIAAVATSGGGFIVVPLLSEAIQRFGWRQGLMLEAAVLAAVLFLLGFFVLRDSPSREGLDDHPENQGRALAEAPVAERKLPLRDILSSRAFWIPSLTLAAISGTCQATVVTLIPYGRQLGFAPTTVALLVSVFAVSAAVTKVGAGLLADHLNRRALLVMAALCMTLSWLVVSVSAQYAALVACAGLAGVGLGFALPTVGALIAGHFGAPSFGSVMGWTYVLVLLFAIIAVLFAASVFDRTGSYVPAFQSFAGFLGGLLLLNLLMPPAKA